MYDGTTPSTFDAMPKWAADVKAGAGEQTVMTMCGNKDDIARPAAAAGAESESDDGDDSVVDDDQSQIMSELLQVPSASVSAKTGEGVDAMFTELVQRIYEQYKIHMQEVRAARAAAKAAAEADAK